MAFFMRVAVTKSATSGGDHNVDTEDLERAKQDLKNLADEMPNVAVRVLNKSMTGIKTDMKNIIRADYNIKAATLGKRVSIYKANRAKIQGHIQSKGGPVALVDVAGTRETARGVIVDVRKSTGRQLFPRAFIQPGLRSGKLVVLRRPGKPRGQHESLWARYGPEGSGGKVGSEATLDSFSGPHPENLYNAPHNWAKIADASAKRIDDNIAREVDAEFRRQEGKW